LIGLNQDVHIYGGTDGDGVHSLINTNGGLTETFGIVVGSTVDTGAYSYMGHSLIIDETVSVKAVCTAQYTYCYGIRLPTIGAYASVVIAGKFEVVSGDYSYGAC
jgi:hypothetical protein